MSMSEIIRKRDYTDWHNRGVLFYDGAQHTTLPEISGPDADFNFLVKLCPNGVGV